MWLLLSFASATMFCGNQSSDYDLNKVNDTIVMLKGIEVHSEKHELFSGSVRSQEIEKNVLERNYYADFSSLLSTHAPVGVKSNGPGLLSTTSLRGGSASHTAFIWNGFNLQCPMNAQNDFSLNPLLFADELQIQYGGGSAIWGSGAVGGAIIMNNKPDFETRQKHSYQFATTSTGEFHNSIRTQWSNGVFATSLRLFHQSSKNQYKFINSYEDGNPTEKQKDAASEGWGLLQETHYKPNNNHLFSITAWYQEYSRNIPASLMFPDFPTALQDDDNLRVTARWQGLFNKIRAEVKTGYFQDNIYYNDYMFTDSKSQSQMQISDAELRYYMHEQSTLSLGFKHKFIRADVDDYSIKPEEHLYTVMASWRWENKNESLITTLNFRQEFAKEFDVEPTPAAGITYKPFNNFSINANVVKSYRLPTLNDRYWSFGGNPDLKPESGWSQDINLELSDLIINNNNNSDKTSFKLDKASIAFFHRNITNWVSWIPDNDGFWYPENILEVRSYGAEAAKSMSYRFGSQTISAALFYSWTKSTYEKTDSDSDPAIGKQLVYTPEHQAGINVGISSGSFRFTYNHRYTGKRYTTTDNSTWLEPYDLADIIISYDTNLLSMGGYFFVKVHNIWNRDYEEMQARPMPLRYLRVGLSLSYSQ